jgi:large subunit GTPase 1
LQAQIVDARNILLFRSADLENYVRECDSKKNQIIIINKADFLSLYARTKWADILRQMGVCID